MIAEEKVTEVIMKRNWGLLKIQGFYTGVAEDSDLLRPDTIFW
jgi:hypothetical protein